MGCLKKTILGKLLREQSKEISWKFYNITKKWSELMEMKKMDIFVTICRVIKTDRKIKFPWTMNETEAAIDFIHSQFLSEDKNF